MVDYLDDVTEFDPSVDGLRIFVLLYSTKYSMWSIFILKLTCYFMIREHNGSEIISTVPNVRITIVHICLL